MNIILTATSVEETSSLDKITSLPQPVLLLAGLILGTIFLLTLGNYLWNSQWRPRKIKSGIPTATFGNIFRRSLRLMFKEDKEQSAKLKKRLPPLAKVVLWRNFNILLLLAFTGQFIFWVGHPFWTLLLGGIVVLLRVKKVLSSRYRITKRMFEVAASEFKYGRGADMNPWAFVNIKSWDSLKIPGATVVSFPAAFKSEDSKNRDNFERHFDGTVTEDNSWVYKWKSSESYVECNPTAHIPTMAQYPGSADRPWDEIPIGVGTEGEIKVSLSSAPHILVTGTTGSGKRTFTTNRVITPQGWTTIGELEVGNKIYDEMGQQVTVTAAHKIEIPEKAYKVTFSSGEEICVDAEHLWYTETRYSRMSASHHKSRENSKDRIMLLPQDKIQILQDTLDSLEVDNTVSITEIAELIDVSPTSGYLFDIGRQVGVAEVVYPQTHFSYKEQVVSQRQQVSIFKTDVIVPALIKSFENVLQSRIAPRNAKSLEVLVNWIAELSENDVFITIPMIAEKLDCNLQVLQRIAGPIFRNSDTRIKKGFNVFAAASEVIPLLAARISMLIADESPIITEKLLDRLKNIELVGETHRFDISEKLGISPDLLKNKIQQFGKLSHKKEEIVVQLAVPQKDLIRKGRPVQRYPQRMFISALIEHGQQLLNDQQHKRVMGSVKTTLEIMDTLYLESGHTNHSVPQVKALVFDEKELLVDPYTLGAWLGDGMSRSGEICGIDHDVMRDIKELYPDVTERVNKHDKHQDFRIWRFKGLVTDLKKYDLVQKNTAQGTQKHIPSVYLRSSLEQRYALLQGLMDTDGTVDPSGQVSFTTVIERLSNEVCELVRTMGYLPRVSSRIPINTTTGKKGKRAYTITFSADPENPVFRLERKNTLHKERYLSSPEGTRGNVRYITNVEEVPSELMRCISVDSPSRLFLVGEGLVPTHNSVLQRNLIFHCIQHKDIFQFFGVDLKRVELRPFAKYDDVVLGIATTLDDALEIIRYVNEEMMRRYEEMESLGVSHFLKLPTPPKATMLMVDEAYQLLAPEGVKTDEGKANDEMHGEATQILGSIARLGRAAGVHLVMATQRPDAKILGGELKSNLAIRIAAGRADAIASAMTLDNDNATRLPGIRGRGYMQINGEGEQFQGYFAEGEWIDQWLATQAGQSITNNDADHDGRQDIPVALAPDDVPQKSKKGLLSKIKSYNASKAAGGDQENDKKSKAINMSKESSAVEDEGDLLEEDDFEVSAERSQALEAVKALSEDFAEDDFDVLEEEFDEVPVAPVEKSRVSKVAPQPSQPAMIKPVTPKQKKPEPEREVYDLEELDDLFSDLDDSPMNIPTKASSQPLIKTPVKPPGVKPVAKDDSQKIDSKAVKPLKAPGVSSSPPKRLPARPERPTLPSRPQRPV